jgi:hypothetical protein
MSPSLPRLFCLVLLVAIPAKGLARERDRLVFCVPRAPDPHVGAALADLVKTAQVVVGSDADCAAMEPSGFSARFEARTGQVVLLLSPARGPVLVRAVPWAAHPESALQSIADTGHLRQLAVLVEGLLAEYRAREALAAAARPAVPDAPAGQPPPAPTEAAEPSLLPIPSPATTSDQLAAPPPARDLPREVALQPEDATPAPTPPAAAQPPAAITPPNQTPVAITPPTQTPPVAVAPPTPPAAPAPQPSRSETPPPTASPSSASWGPFSVTASAAWKWRSPSLATWQVGGRLAWRRFFLSGAYSLPASWSLEDRPIEVRGLTFTAGWRPSVWEYKKADLSVIAAVALDRLELRRTDESDATSHAQFDVGPFAGLELTYVAEGWLHLSIGLEGAWYPTAHLVQIPNGPSQRFNIFCLGATLRVGWTQ